MRRGRKQRSGEGWKVLVLESVSVGHKLLWKRLHTDLSECVYVSVISARLCTPLMPISSYIEVTSGCQRLQ